jgi:hypothetical protein
MLKVMIIVLITIFNIYANEDLLGRYQLNVSINQSNFTDFLIIKEAKEGALRGEFIVPNVFQTPFFGSYKPNKIMGEFRASENGHTFQVILESKISNDTCFLMGTLSSDGNVFGHFTGRKADCI